MSHFRTFGGSSGGVPFIDASYNHTSHGHLTEKSASRCGTRLDLSFTIGRTDERSEPKELQYTVAYSVQVHMIFERTKDFRDVHTVNIALWYNKLNKDDALEYEVTCSSFNLNLKSDKIPTKKRWIRAPTCFQFDIQFEVDIKPPVTKFAGLYHDRDLIDFELRGEDGSVGVHKVLLAAYSPVMKRMLAGEWKEKSESKLDIPSISRSTLQHLKDYIYLHKLPEQGLEELLLLASCYMIPDLEQKCVFRLIENMTADRAYDLLEFAHRHNSRRLMVGVVSCADAEEMQRVIIRAGVTLDDDADGVAAKKMKTSEP